MKKMTRLFALFVASVLVAGMMSACTTDAPAGGTADAPAASSVAVIDEIAGDIEVWHIWTEGDQGTTAKAYQKVVADFRAAYPNIKLTQVATENEAYKVKLSTASTANELPDVFFGWGPGEVKPMVDAGRIAALDDYLDKDYLASVNGGSLDNFTFDGKTYGLTFYLWAAALYCNEEMFEAVDAPLPTTYEELLEAIKIFNDNGIVPITVGAKDAWTAMFWQNIMAVRMLGAETCNKMLAGELSFDDPGIVASAQYVLDLVEAGAFDPGALAISNDEAKIEFMTGLNPMHFIGDWLIGEITDPAVATIDPDKVVALNFPAIKDGKFNDQVLGGATDGFMIAEKSENKEVAAIFIKYVTDNLSRECFAIGGAAPTRSSFDMADYEVDRLPGQVASYAGLATGSVLAWDTFLSGQAKDTHLDLCQQLFAGEISAEDFAKEMAAQQQ